MDDATLVAKAQAARNGTAFSALWSGDLSAFNDDDSAGDLALCNHLAFWTGRDVERMDRLFRQSALMRTKWDSRRGDATYGRQTIDRAIADCSSVYQPPTEIEETNDDERADACVAASTAASRRLLGPADRVPPVYYDVKEVVPLGLPDPLTGRLVLSPRRTLPTAEAFVEAFYQHPDGRCLHSHADVLVAWENNAYAAVEDTAVLSRLQVWLHDALRPRVNRKTGAITLVPFESNPAAVNNALASIHALTHVSATLEMPSWLDATPRLSALEILPCRSSSVHVPTRTVIPATPALFTTNALAFDYDADAAPPACWLAFLDQLWWNDADSIALLQEWFGYCLIPDTTQQKMLLLVGPRRSGKGTIGRILTRLVGAANAVGPTTSSLAGQFGLQPLIGKSLALVSDARFSGDNVSVVTERLLCISGEDTLSIDRKYLGAVSMRLPTRFMFLTNELPRLNDASTALAGRFLILQLTQSFYGMEDPTLTDTLSTELPGILLWALDGWERLHARGYFAQPASVADAVEDLEDLASPVRPFVRECCTVLPELRVRLDVLYPAWEMWCAQTGRKATTRQLFGRDLCSAVPGIKRRRDTAFSTFYDGLSLTAEAAAALDRFQRRRQRSRDGESD
jgi:putative DNA primase/helicase